MKTLYSILFFLFTCISLQAQIDNYAGIGYTPRIIRSSPLMDVLQAYEANYDSIVIPFNNVQFTNGISFTNSYAIEFVNIGTDIGVSYYSTYGEQINDNGGLSTAKLRFIDLSFRLDANTGVVLTDHFFAGLGGGLTYEVESISGNITNSNYWGGLQGGISDNESIGGILYALFLFDLGDYVISVRPNIQTFLNNYRYDDLYEELTKEYDVSYPRTTSLIGFDVHFNGWY